MYLYPLRHAPQMSSHYRSSPTAAAAPPFLEASVGPKNCTEKFLDVEIFGEIYTF